MTYFKEGAVKSRSYGREGNLGNNKINPFKKACKRDVDSKTGALKVHVYKKAREEANTDFSFDTDEKIKGYFADLEDHFFHYYKQDYLDNVIFGIPVGTPFDVFHFAFEKPKDGYLAVLKPVGKDFWLIKSCKKNNTSEFANPAFSGLNQRDNKEDKK